MAKVRLPVDVNNRNEVADECDRVAGLRPREYPSIAYVQALLKAAAANLRKKPRGRPPANVNNDLSAGV